MSESTPASGLRCTTCNGSIGLGACRWVSDQPYHINCSPNFAGREGVVAPLTAPAEPDNNPKTAYGVRKPQMHAVPPVALLALGAVMMLGKRKYGLTNWRDKTISASTYYDAALRHMFLYWDGEDIDPESGQPHVAHAMACMTMILDATAQGNFNDDRPKTPGATSRVIAEGTTQP